MCKQLKQQILLALLAIIGMPSAMAVPDDWGYAGLGVGYSSLASNRANIISSYSQLSNSASIESTATSFHGFFGGYFDDYLGLEGEMLLTGSVIGRDNGSAYKLFEASGFSIVGILSYPLGEQFRLFGKLGAQLWDVAEDSNPDDSVDSGVGATYGIGMDINVYGGRERQLRVQINRYHYSNVFLDTGYIASVGLLFSFGDSQ